jgi:hypothetical protein
MSLIKLEVDQTWLGNERINTKSWDLEKLKCELKKSGRSPILKKTHILLVFIYPNETT